MADIVQLLSYPSFCRVYKYTYRSALDKQLKSKLVPIHHIYGKVQVISTTVLHFTTMSSKALVKCVITYKKLTCMTMWLFFIVLMTLNPCMKSENKTIHFTSHNRPPPRYPSGTVPASSAGGPGFNPQSRTAPYQRRYKNGTSSALVQH